MSGRSLQREDVYEFYRLALSGAMVYWSMRWGKYTCRTERERRGASHCLVSLQDCS